MYAAYIGHDVGILLMDLVKKFGLEVELCCSNIQLFLIRLFSSIRVILLF